VVGIESHGTTSVWLPFCNSKIGFSPRLLRRILGAKFFIVVRNPTPFMFHKNYTRNNTCCSIINLFTDQLLFYIPCTIDIETMFPNIYAELGNLEQKSMTGKFFSLEVKVTDCKMSSFFLFSSVPLLVYRTAFPYFS
jgi:hypothetical protein